MSFMKIISGAYAYTLPRKEHEGRSIVPSLDNVIKGIKACTGRDQYSCKKCPYDSSYGCRAQVMKDALVYLKKLEPKQPAQDKNKGYWGFVCPSCGSHDQELAREWSFCPCCGMAIDWDPVWSQEEE